MTKEVPKKKKKLPLIASGVWKEEIRSSGDNTNATTMDELLIMNLLYDTNILFVIVQV